MSRFSFRDARGLRASINRPTRQALAEAEAVVRAEKQARRAERAPRVTQKPVKVRRQRDASYLSWLHEDLPCIACLVLGAPSKHTPIEAAHQKMNAPERGVFKRMGVRPDDQHTCPLCAWHHREGPLCCDPAQAKFWSIIGLDPTQVIDFCRELYAAFEQERDGVPIIHDFAAIAAGQRADIQHIGRGA